MTAYYSDHFAGQNAVTYADDNTVLAMDKRQDPYLRHGRMRYSRAEVTIDLELGDTVRMMELKTSDCINHVFLTCTAAGAAGEIEMGFFSSSGNHTGPMIEQNILTFDRDVTSALAHVEVFDTGFPANTEFLRGKPLWELVSVVGSQASYTKDPGENWDLTLGCAGDGTATTNATTFVVEIYFTSGD